jgi:prevent-host-death family protein
MVSHQCYSCRMHTVASRELRNQTRSLLDRVATGEQITITVDGRPVALLTPVVGRTRWMPREMFLQTVLAHQADPALRSELGSLAPDTTDDLPL